jgi:hypothetical protein
MILSIGLKIFSIEKIVLTNGEKLWKRNSVESAMH